MSNLWWPGAHRADAHLSDAGFLAAMVRTEQVWLDALVQTEVAPPGACVDLTDAASDVDVQQIAVDAEAGGNPVIPLVSALRDRVDEPAATWLHRGLTSQDVVDTALILTSRDAVTAALAAMDRQIVRLSQLAEDHRRTPCVARTLTQYAVPTRFGVIVAGWLEQILHAREDLARLRWPAQFGGAAGTSAALVELAGPIGGQDAARHVRQQATQVLGLEAASPWHTTRTPITRIGDATATACDAWGRIARDVLTRARPEIGELVDRSAGGSSTMPHKANPTLAVLVRRAAITAPPLAATLHAAAGDQVDQRADGAWHAEWDTLRILLQRTLVAAEQTADLLDSLEVRADRMAERLAAVQAEVRAEQTSMAAVAGHDPADDYAGLSDDIIDAALTRAVGPAGEERP